MTNPTLERAARAACEYISFNDEDFASWDELSRKNKAEYCGLARAVLMAVLPTLERYDSDYAGEYKDERGDYVLYADLQAILNDGEGE